MSWDVAARPFEDLRTGGGGGDNNSKGGFGLCDKDCKQYMIANCSC